MLVYEQVRSNLVSSNSQLLTARVLVPSIWMSLSLEFNKEMLVKDTKRSKKLWEILSHTIYIILGVSHSIRSDYPFFVSLHPIDFCIWCFALRTTELDFIIWWLCLKISPLFLVSIPVYILNSNWWENKGMVVW